MAVEHQQPTFVPPPQQEYGYQEQPQALQDYGYPQQPPPLHAGGYNYNPDQSKMQYVEQPPHQPPPNAQQHLGPQEWEHGFCNCCHDSGVCTCLNHHHCYRFAEGRRRRNRAEIKKKIKKNRKR
jgi:hypothetical protein